MDLLTPKDFNNTPYNVPNALAQQPSGGVEENADFANYINETVKDALIKLLGVPFYDSFMAALDLLPAEWVDTNSYLVDDEVFYNYHVWKSLVDDNMVIPNEGTHWTMVPDSESEFMPPPVLEFYNGTTYGMNQWVGIKKTFVPGVYALWLRDTYDDHTKNGVVRRAGENSIPIDPTLRIARAYMKYSAYVDSMFHYLANAGALTYNAYGYQYDVNHIYPYYYYRPQYGTFNFPYGYGYGLCKYPGRMNIFNI